jgi:hypothetical protein
MCRPLGIWLQRAQDRRDPIERFRSFSIFQLEAALGYRRQFQQSQEDPR